MEVAFISVAQGVLIICPSPRVSVDSLCTDLIGTGQSHIKVVKNIRLFTK
jgi:hypothetical protein